MRNLAFVISFLACAYITRAQTCCSAGAPTSSSLEIGVGEAKQWSLQMDYEYKSINMLISNNERLTNDPRTRFGQSASVKVDYAYSEKWAFSAFLPLVYQSRTSFSESQSSLGLGDLMLLAQYNSFIGKSTKLFVSSGLKLPTGFTGNKGQSGILLSPDMQSGSGSIDYLFRLALLKENFLHPLLSAITSVTYRRNGINEHFGQTDTFSGRRFGFGDEGIATVGLRYLYTSKHGFFTPDLSFKYRYGTANTEQTTDAPNSGGQWFSLPMGLSFAPDARNFFRAYVELPLYQTLEGLQITTNLVVGVQYKYTFNSTNN